MSFVIPIEVVAHIANFLPLKSKLRMRRLCKFMKAATMIFEEPIFRDRIKTVVQSLNNELIHINQNELTILGRVYQAEKIINAIPSLMGWEFLAKLLSLDEKLLETRRSFQKKHYVILKQNDGRWDTKGELSHLNKTNDCYKKYNNDLRKVCGNDHWFEIIKRLMSTNTNVGLIPYWYMTHLEKTYYFGQKILQHYNSIKEVIKTCKNRYFDKKYRRY